MSVSDDLLDAASHEGNEEKDLVSATPLDNQPPTEDTDEQKIERDPFSTMKHNEQLLDTSADQSTVVSTPQAPSIPVSTTPASSRPTLIEVFTGQAIDVLDKLFQAQETADKFITELRKAQKQANELLSKSATERLEQVEQIKASIDAALAAYQWTPGKIWLYQWSLVILLIGCGLSQAIYVELYCRWHGASFISLDLYDPVNVDILSKIDFVNGPTTMSIAAEVLMWSSLGVWAQQSYANTMAMLRRKFRFAEHGPRYIGVMMRNTSVASIIVILLRLSKFSIFGVSLDGSNPMAFDVTIGLSFLLGFFGDDAYRILSSFKDRLVKGILQEERED